MIELWRAGDPRLCPSTRTDDVRRLLMALAPDGDQRDQRARMLAFLDDHPDALERTCGPGHFTGSAMVVDVGARRVLLLFHRKLRRWLQPGGHADGDANLVGVALREAIEETGIDSLGIHPRPVDLDVHAVSGPGEPRHLHFDVRFAVVAPPEARPRGNHESEALRWATPDELRALVTDESTERLVEATARLLQW